MNTSFFRVGDFCREGQRGSSSLIMPPIKLLGLTTRSASDRAADEVDPPRSGAHVAGEHRILTGCRRSHDILDQLHNASSERPSRFKTVGVHSQPSPSCLSDTFYLALQGATRHTLHCQHASTAEMLDLYSVLCADLTVLHAWRFKDEQLELVAARLQPVCGYDRHFSLRVSPVVPLDIPLGEICDAPFLLSTLFILVSEQCHPQRQVLHSQIRGRHHPDLLPQAPFLGEQPEGSGCSMARDCAHYLEGSFSSTSHDTADFLRA